MNEQEKRLFDVTQDYMEQFGPDELLPTFQLPAEQTTPEFLTGIYERCLRENKPASHFVTVPDLVEALY